jgi:copper(I)-binding protein
VSSVPAAVRALTVAGLVVALAGGLSACGSSSSGGTRTAAVASTTAAEPITVSQAWVRTTEGAMDVTMAPLYVTLKNSEAGPMTLTSGTAALASRVEFHEMVMKEGAMVMQPKAGGITIPAGGSATLKPGGDHVMLMGLKQPLPVGSEVTVDLTFSDGTRKTVIAPVKKYADGNAQYAGTGSGTASMSMSPTGTGTSSMSSMPGTTTP